MSISTNLKWIETLLFNGPIPQEVRECGDRIARCEVWWQASINLDENGNHREVRSCREAAQFRNRLGAGGNGGIPLWAELKTRAGEAVNVETGDTILFAAHSRANTEFDDTLILKALGLDLAKTEIRTELDAEASSDKQQKLSKSKYFGRINPFNADLILRESLGIDVTIGSIRHVFDISVSMHGGYPNTVMSNLGHKAFAFEIHPEHLISSVKKLARRTTVANIAKVCQIWLGLAGKWERNKKKPEWLRFPPPKGPKIGILTGNAPESGLTLWQDTLAVFRERFPKLSDVLMPEVHVHSLPAMGLSMELVSREDHVWEEIQRAITALLELGCKIITIACNTTIYYEDRIKELCDRDGAKFISIAKSCVAALNDSFAQKDSEVRSVELLGISPVVDMEGTYSGYKSHLVAAKIKVKPCPADNLAYAFKQKGAEDKTLATDFNRLISTRLANKRVIILALTEASIIYRKHITTNGRNRWGNKVFIDPLMELAKHLVHLYLLEGYENSVVCQIPNDFSLSDKLLQLKVKFSKS